MKKKCLICKKNFQAKTNRTLYCSEECRKKGNREKQRKLMKQKRAEQRKEKKKVLNPNTDVTEKPKKMLELIEPAKKGEYQAYDVFTVVDSTKEEDGEAGEGNLVFVHVNEAFEYDKQTLEELESEAKVTVIKYADLVKQD
ncbi:TPA: hypothetical protein VET22_000919 [Streptococcus pyogenes]|nr:hypothetical protein [Streptococcus pyogenes]